MGDALCEKNEIAQRKRELRRQYRERRKNESPCYRASSDERIFKNLCSLPAFQQSALVLAFVSVGGEPETRKIVEAALDKQKTVGMPLCDENSCTMAFYAVDSFSCLKPGAYGIPEPDPSRYRRVEEKTGLCLVPALAFDREGARLGHGNGYYDRYLSGFHGVSVGLCRESLLSSQPLPSGPFDIRVNWIVTENEILKIK